MGPRDQLIRLVDIALAFPFTDPSPEEVLMSALTDAVANLVSRVQADFAHLRDLLDQALATDVADQATIDALRAEANAVQAETQAAIDAMNAVDPDPSFPEAPPAG